MPAKKETTFRIAALSVTRWIGSPASLLIHTLLFMMSFGSVWLGYIGFESMLLVLTTIVSLEAIYLSIFIQMSINFTTASLEEVEQDIDEIQEDVGEIQEDVEELQEDVETMSEDDSQEDKEEDAHQKTLTQIQADLRKLVEDISKLQNQQKN